MRDRKMRAGNPRVVRENLDAMPSRQKKQPLLLG